MCAARSRISPSLFALLLVAPLSAAVAPSSELPLEPDDAHAGLGSWADAAAAQAAGAAARRGVWRRPNLSRRITIELFQNKEIPKGLAENVARAVSTKAPTAGGGSAASSAYTTE